MRIRTAVALACALTMLPAALLAETWTGVPLVDRNCSNKVKDDPDAHPRECALKCAASGYGILTADGGFLAFDADGSKRALQALEASEKADHLRVDVTGTVEEGVLKVESLKLLD